MLISTDNGAKGFNLEDAAFIIHYDLLYNTLKMEQRIDRCHRLGQQNDVLSVAFINKENFSDVRKLELVSKRMLVSNGVFGVSDDVIGGFTDNAASAFDVISARLRTTAQVEADHQSALASHAEENKQLVASAEDMLCTTFTKELADKVKLTPRYIAERAEELNRSLWELTKWFFTRYNAEHTDCCYEIDDAAQTITATQYDTLPVLFYYWDGSRNRKYQSQKTYGMGRDFKPRHGRITLTSIIGRGILHELECADTGTLAVHGCTEACTLGLYHVAILSGKRRVTERSILVGKTDSGAVLSEDQCRALMALPMVDYTETGHKAPHWLKRSGKPHELDKLVPVQELIDEQAARLSPAQEEEAERLKRENAAGKAALFRELDAQDRQIKVLETERGQITGDRLKILALDKQINQLRREYMTRQESQFFEAMKRDVELEEKLKELSYQNKVTARVIREYIVWVVPQ